MTAPQPLKLRARDAADMDVVAACLQDSLVPLRDLRWLRREKRFVMVVNRFMWERAATDEGGGDEEAAGRPEAADAGQDVAGQDSAGQDSAGQDAAEPNDASFEDAEARPTHWRSNAALVFDKVRGVKVQGIDLTARDQFLNLLTMASEPKRITFHFSGGARLRLEVAEIRCRLKDLGEPWPTWSVPAHEEPSGPQEPSPEAQGGRIEGGPPAPPGGAG